MTKVGDPKDFQQASDMTQVEALSFTTIQKMFLPCEVTLIWK